MVDMTPKMEVIARKNSGESNRCVARQTGLDRETMTKYWEEYKGNSRRIDVKTKVQGKDTNNA